MISCHRRSATVWPVGVSSAAPDCFEPALGWSGPRRRPLGRQAPLRADSQRLALAGNRAHRSCAGRHAHEERPSRRAMPATARVASGPRNGLARSAAGQTGVRPASDPRSTRKRAPRVPESDQSVPNVRWDPVARDLNVVTGFDARKHLERSVFARPTFTRVPMMHRGPVRPLDSAKDAPHRSRRTSPRRQQLLRTIQMGSHS